MIFVLYIMRVFIFLDIINVRINNFKELYFILFGLKCNLCIYNYFENKLN